MTKIKQFNYTIRGFEFYGLCELQSIEALPLIVRCTDLYLEGYGDNSLYDVKEIVDYQVILDIEDMVRIEHENPRGANDYENT
jgi:hypothetical protein